MEAASRPEAAEDDIRWIQSSVKLKTCLTEAPVSLDKPRGLRHEYWGGL